MYGTDQLAWPGLMAYSIGLIHLSPEHLYNNAARFLRLDEGK